MNSFLPVRGFHDNIDPFFLFKNVYEVCSNIAIQSSFVEVVSPVVERSQLFEKNIGEGSDIVLKELYKFNFHDEWLALRPEFTAGITRLFISNEPIALNHANKTGFRAFSFGPLFRHDRPQAGRYRQFYQANFEIFKESSHYCDISSIYNAVQIINVLNAQNKPLTLKINSLGSSQTKEKYRQELSKYFSSFKQKLSQDSLKRLEKDPIRIIDSKEECDIELVKNAPKIDNIRTTEETKRIDLIKISLTNTIQNPLISLKYDESLVRGLDYYSSTVFEIVDNSLDLTIAAGGRYDNLVSDLSNNKYNASAFGFACGVERLIMSLMTKDTTHKESVGVVILEGLEDNIAFGKTSKLALALNNDGYVTKIISQEKSLGKTLSNLEGDGFTHFVVVGKSELQTSKAILKNFKSKEEKQIAF